MTRLKIYNATAVVPTLARLVLCAAFLSMGWNKLMNTHEFTGNAAATLIELGVVDDAKPNARVVPAAFIAEQAASETASDAPADADEPVAGNDDADAEAPAATDIPDDVMRQNPVTGEPVVHAKRMHTVTLGVHRAGWAQPVALAWLTTLTELIGGGLLLVGLFSRVWGLGLAIVMAAAFYLTSYGQLLEVGPFAMAADIESGYAAFNRMYVQLGLGVLALGVFLTGPGPLSLDRLLFRPNHAKDPDYDDMP